MDSVRHILMTSKGGIKKKGKNISIALLHMEANLMVQKLLRQINQN